jgi:hypothetical protein
MAIAIHRYVYVATSISDGKDKDKDKETANPERREKCGEWIPPLYVNSGESVPGLGLGFGFGLTLVMFPIHRQTVVDPQQLVPAVAVHPRVLVAFAVF